MHFRVVLRDTYKVMLFVIFVLLKQIPSNLHWGFSHQNKQHPYSESLILYQDVKWWKLRKSKCWKIKKERKVTELAGSFKRGKMTKRNFKSPGTSRAPAVRTSTWLPIFTAATAFHPISLESYSLKRSVHCFPFPTFLHRFFWSFK